jgi:branched-chain amino acid transport system permease protein
VSSRAPGRLITYLAIAAFVGAIPVIVGFDDYIIHLFIITGLTIVLTSSLRLVYRSGIWHMGQAGFYAIGAYCIHFLEELGGLTFWEALPITGFCGALIAVGLGFVTLRVKKIYFAVLSIAFVEVVRLAITNIVGAKSSIVSTPPVNSIVLGRFLDISFASRSANYYFILGLVIITLLCLWRLERSRYGFNFTLIEQNEDLAESIGVNALWHQIGAFAVCSFFGAISGGYFAAYNGIISPDGFSVWYSITLVIIVIVGGADSFWGPVIGSVLMIIVPTFIPAGAPEKIFYAILCLLVMYFLPRGLITLPGVIFSKRRTRL